jgi:hypothetical protein
VKCLRKARLPSATSSYQQWNVTYAAYVVSHTQQFSACTKLSLEQCLFETLAPSVRQGKNVAISFVKKKIPLRLHSVVQKTN